MSARPFRVFGSPARPEPASAEILVGGVLQRVTLWSEDQWQAIPLAERPPHCVRVGDRVLRIARPPS